MIPKIHRVLRDCVNAETAFVQPDYPYGARLRCKRRNWLEFKPGKTGGFRYVHQTSDPKSSFGAGTRWNKPKHGTYTWLAVLVVTDEYTSNGEPSAVTTFGLGLNDSEDALDAFEAAFDRDLDENQKKQAALLRLLIPRYGTRKSGKLFRVSNAETGALLPPQLVTAGHKVFAASLTTSTGDLSLLRRDGTNQDTVEIAADVLTGLKKYNPPLQYIDEHRRFGLMDSYYLGKRLLVEYVPDAAVEGAAKLSRKGLIEAAKNTVPEVPPSRRRTDEAWPLKSVNAHITPDTASEFCPEPDDLHIDPDQAASPFSDQE